MKELRRLFKMHFTQIALEEVLTGVSVHMAHEVGPVFKGFLADGTLVGSLRAVGALVMRQV